MRRNEQPKESTFFPERIRLVAGVEQTIYIKNKSGKEVGFLRVICGNHPFDFVKLEFLEVDSIHQKQGHAGRALGYLEKELQRLGVPGFLIDGIAPSSYAKGMYDKRSGWSAITFEGFTTVFMYGRTKAHTDELIEEAVEPFANKWGM